MNANYLPNFFIVGASKCGTTALSDYLRRHPQVFIVRDKETHFFCTDFDKRYPRPQSTSDYMSLFRKAPGKKAIGEASPWYIYSEYAIQNAYQFNPAARFIVMVRNPLEMVPSLHRQLLNNHDEDQQDLTIAWRLQSQRKKGTHIPSYCRETRLLQYRDTCKLGRQIQKMFSIVPINQCMVIILDDLKQDAKRVYQSVLSFLELDDDGLCEFPVVNESFHWRFKKVSNFIITPPKYIQTVGFFLLNLIGRKRVGLFKLLYHLNNQFNRKKHNKKELDQDLKQELIETFTDDIHLLSKLLTRDLTGWLN